MDTVNHLNTLNTLNLEHGGALNGHCCESEFGNISALNILNTLNAVNLDLEHGGALNGCCESSKHSEHSEFGTWWCFEWTL